jgi:3-polyprenyl-4-hydroxybenzoate decarboxylase
MPNVPHLVDETTGAAINLPVANYLTSDLRAPAAAEIVIESRILRVYRGVNAKMGLDASKPAVYDQHVFTRVRIPGEDEVDLEREVDARARPDWAKILAE